MLGPGQRARVADLDRQRRHVGRVPRELGRAPCAVARVVVRVERARRRRTTPPIVAPIGIVVLIRRARPTRARAPPRRHVEQARHRALQRRDRLGRLAVDHLRHRPRPLVLLHHLGNPMPEAAKERVVGPVVGPAAFGVVGRPRVDQRNEPSLAFAGRVHAQEVGLVVGEEFADAVGERRRELDAPRVVTARRARSGRRASVRNTRNSERNAK